MEWRKDVSPHKAFRNRTLERFSYFGFARFNSPRCSPALRPLQDHFKVLVIVRYLVYDAILKEIGFVAHLLSLGATARVYHLRTIPWRQKGKRACRSNRLVIFKVSRSTTPPLPPISSFRPLPHPFPP